MGYKFEDIKEGQLAELPKLREVQLYLYPDVMFDSEQIRCSKDAASIFRGCYNTGHIGLREEFKALYLNKANYALAYCTHSIGAIGGTMVDTKQIMATGLKLMASGIILCHNHPSGNPKPSQTDINLTKQFAKAAQYFEIQLLDHIILTSTGYHSMADEMEM